MHYKKKFIQLQYYKMFALLYKLFIIFKNSPQF